jgi:hypothetical protein
VSIWVEVRTNLRSYCVRGGARVAWLPGEEVVSIEIAEDATAP